MKRPTEQSSAFVRRRRDASRKNKEELAPTLPFWAFQKEVPPPWRVVRRMYPLVAILCFAYWAIAVLAEGATQSYWPDLRALLGAVAALLLLGGVRFPRRHWISFVYTFLSPIFFLVLAPEFMRALGMLVGGPVFLYGTVLMGRTGVWQWARRDATIQRTLGVIDA